MEYFFPDKSNNLETITLVENNMIISDNQKITDPFIEYIDTMVPKLGLAIPKDVSLSNLQNEFKSVDSRKSVHESEIPAKILICFHLFLLIISKNNRFLKFPKPFEISKYNSCSQKRLTKC